MNHWKKLFFVVAALPVSLLWSDSCSTGCNTSTSCSTGTNANCAGGHAINKSVYVTPVNPWSSGSYLHEYMFRNDRMEKGDDCSWGSAFQVAVFGGATAHKGRTDLGRRFGLNGQNCMLVLEDNAAAALGQYPTGSGDLARTIAGAVIDPSNFNLVTVNGNFESTICFSPKETQVGALLSWKQSLCSTDEGHVRWWFEINAPIVHVKHTMGLCETIINDGGGAEVLTAPFGLDGAQPVGTMTQAFNQASWTAGKISNCEMSHTELANLEFKVGYNFLTQGECCRVGSYLGFAAPTTHKRTAQYVFEPVVGIEHWAIMWGTTYDIKMCEWENSCFNAHLAIDARWWFGRDERRTFDLIGKPWSRYQAFYANQEQAAIGFADASRNFGTAGVNVLTRCVEVTPGYQINCNSAFAYQGCRFSAEIGHTFYARQAEHIKPNWVAGAAVKDALTPGDTNLARTITYQFDPVGTPFADYNDNIIQTCQVDWNTGGHEGTLAHSLYGAVGYSMDNWCYPTFIGFGGAYDFGTEDKGTSVMRAWNVFGKLDVTF